MGNVFHRQHPISAQDRAILDLKVQRDKLKLYQRRIQVVLDRELAIARHHLAQDDKKRALLALRKKKYQQSLLDKTDIQLLNLEELVNSIEFALVESQVVKGLRDGVQVLKQLNDEMRMEDVEKLMDDNADALAYQKDVEELLTGSISPEQDAEALEELEQLEKAQLMAEGFPEVPKTEPEKKIVVEVQPEVESETDKIEPVKPTSKVQAAEPMLES